jgi:tetratricopeptide (TPR) repeat protein
MPGQLAPARVHLDEAIGLFDRHRIRSDTVSSLTDPGVTCRYAAAMVLQALGYADQARWRSEEALALAEARAASPFTRGNLLGILALFHLARREGTRAQAHAEAALVARGRPQEALTPLHQGLAAYDTMGEQLFQPLALAVLADALGHLEQPAEALRVFAKAQEIMEGTDERFYATDPREEPERAPVRDKISHRSYNERQRNLSGSVRHMQVNIELPDDVSHALEARWGNVSRRTLEAIALEGYRSGALTESQVRRLLGFETRMDVHAFLKQAGVPPHYTEADFEDDLKAHRKLGLLPRDR